VDAPYWAMAWIELKTAATSRSTAHGAQVIKPLDYIGRP